MDSAFACPSPVASDETNFWMQYLKDTSKSCKDSGPAHFETALDNLSDRFEKEHNDKSYQDVLQKTLKDYWALKNTANPSEIVIIGLEKPEDLHALLSKVAPSSWIRNLLDEEDGLWIA